MFDYEKTLRTSTRLIAKLGKTIIKKSVVNSGAEWNPTQMETESTITGVILNYKKDELVSTLIQSTDKKLLTVSEISTSDLITDDGKTYTVMSVQELKPADVTLLYTVQLRL